MAAQRNGSARLKLWVLLIAPMLLGGCTPTSSRLKAPVRTQEAMKNSASETGVTNLPFAQGKAFRTLDEYVAHRRKLGAQDVPYYEETAPGTYRLRTGRGERFSEPQYFTRAQLLKEFGFKE